MSVCSCKIKVSKQKGYYIKWFFYVRKASLWLLSQAKQCIKRKGLWMWNINRVYVFQGVNVSIVTWAGLRQFGWPFWILCSLWLTRKKIMNASSADLISKPYLRLFCWLAEIMPTELFISCFVKMEILLERMNTFNGLQKEKQQPKRTVVAYLQNHRTICNV